MKIITKQTTGDNFNAGSKAKNDILRITGFENLYLRDTKLNLGKVFNKITRFIKLYFQIIKINDYDLFMIQHPLYISRHLNKQLYNKNIVYLIHDLHGLRTLDEKYNIHEMKLLKHAKFIISHNQVMTDYLISQGIDKNKIVNLDLFDYLCDEVEYKN